MPELPEVEVVRAGLAPAVTGATVLGVTVLDERALTRHPADGADFEARLTGRVVRAAARRGKFLWLPLAPAAGDGPAAEAVVGHLGMSGQLLLRASGAAPERHERVIAGHQPMMVAIDLEQELPRQDVERLLERVEVTLHPSAGRQGADRELGVDGALRCSDEHGAR